MAFETLLDHTCDIYHIRKTGKSPGYTLPASPSFSYDAEPDLTAVPCHFSTKTGAAGGITIVQKQPQANHEAKLKLELPLGTDVRLNDKIVGLGYEFTAEIPRTVRNHHIAVMLHRSGAQEPLK
jgi:hypothetical protein